MSAPSSCSDTAIVDRKSLTESIARFAGSKPLRFSLAMVFVLQLLVVVLFRPTYETNDDVFMSMIAAGKGISHAPDSHLLFTNILVGKLLQTLYTAFPFVPWYGCYLLLTHFAAQVAVLYCTLVIGKEVHGAVRGNEMLVRLGVYAIYYLLVELPLLNRLQFTSTAFLASMASLFLFFLAWQRYAQRQDNAAAAGLLVAAGLLLLIGGLIRPESLAMALLLAVPVTVVFIRDFNWRAMSRCGAVATTAAGLVLAAWAYDLTVYESDQDWQGFRGFNALRGTFHDAAWTRYTPETQHVFSEVGWSENDHALIARWFSDDAELYSQEKLTAVATGYPWQSIRQAGDLWKSTFKNMLRSRSVLSVLLILPFVLATVCGGPDARRAVVGSLLAAFALVVLITYTKKTPPERVLFPLMSFPLAVTLLSFAWRKEKQEQQGYSFEGLLATGWSWSAWWRRPFRSRVLITLMCVAMVMGVYRQCRRSVLDHRGQVALREYSQQIDSTGETVYVAWEAALPFELLSPLDNLDAWSDVSLISLTWNQGTPWHEATKSRHGISNLARAISQRSDVVLIARPQHKDLFATFAEEHFGADVAFEQEWEEIHRFVAGRYLPRHAVEQTAVAPNEQSRF